MMRKPASGPVGPASIGTAHGGGSRWDRSWANRSGGKRSPPSSWRSGADPTGSRRSVTRSPFLEERLAPLEPRGDADHLGQFPAGRRVGRQEAGRPRQDQRALLGAGRPGVELADGRLVGLEPVELGVLVEQRPAELGDDPGGGAAAGGGLVGDRPRPPDPPPPGPPGLPPPQ